MSDYCVNLSLNINPLANGLTVDDLILANEIKSPWILVNLDHINPELKMFFDSIGLVIVNASLFVLEENRSGVPHLDGRGISDLAKINWAYNNTDHDMIWYKIKDQTLQKPVHVRTFNNPSIRYNDDELEEVHRQPIGFPSLVQAGIPHNVLNYTGIRKCLSIPLIQKTDNPNSRKTVSMNDAKQLFSKHLT